VGSMERYMMADFDGDECLRPAEEELRGPGHAIGPMSGVISTPVEGEHVIPEVETGASNVEEVE
jgi:hypothetical protein